MGELAVKYTFSDSHFSPAIVRLPMRLGSWTELGSPGHQGKVCLFLVGSTHPCSPHESAWSSVLESLSCLTFGCAWGDLWGHSASEHPGWVSLASFMFPDTEPPSSPAFLSGRALLAMGEMSLRKSEETTHIIQLLCGSVSPFWKPLWPGEWIFTFFCTCTWLSSHSAHWKQIPMLSPITFMPLLVTLWNSRMLRAGRNASKLPLGSFSMLIRWFSYTFCFW